MSGLTLSGIVDRFKDFPPPDINGREEYLQTAVVALMVGEGEALSLVFEKRNAKIRQGGEVCFPGGRFDPELDASFSDTAVRETSEEIGIPKSSIAVLGKLDTVLAPMGTIVEPFVGHTVISPERFLPNRDEVEELFTVPLSFFLRNPPEEYAAEIRLFPKVLNPSTGEVDHLFPAEALGLPERYHESWGGSRAKIYVYRTDGGIVWGLTARIVMDLCRKIGPRRS